MKQYKKYDRTSLADSFSSGIVLFFLMLTIAGCKKDKADFEYDNRKVTDARKSSTVRIVNLAGYNQVQLNGDTLTNYIVRMPNDPLGASFPATKYFTDNGRLGTTWSIPQDLLKQSAAKIKVEHLSYSGIKDPLELVIQEDAQQPFDYYLLPTQVYAQVTGQPAMIKIPRSVTTASDPSHFKVRILNLSAAVLPTEGMENLRGPMSLTWADGTPVSNTTNNIQPGQYSDYIDLPYTTAQLKVLTSTGIQVPGYSNTAELLNPSTSTIEGLTLSYIPLKSYMPGGIYTIVVAAREYTIPYRSGNPGETVSGYQNSIRVINDISETANVTYGRMQAVNVMPGMNGITIRLNGKTLGAATDYTAHTDYEAFVAGTYKAEALNAAGAVIATTTIDLGGNTNYTLWVHPDGSGKAVISAVANNLSGIFNKEATDDATYARFKDEFPFAIRFLNLCHDMPYLTMTTDNAQSFSTVYGFNSLAVNNLRPGTIPVESPYVNAAINATPYQLMAFRSSPAVIPGTWASDIPVLTGQDLIARPALYTRGALPNHEPGIYTIALVGSTNPAASAAQKAKMIIVKHSK